LRVGPPAYNPVEFVGTIGTNIDEFQAEFDDTSPETMFVKFTVPDEYTGGTRNLVVWWLSTTAAFGDAVWDVRTRSIADDAVWDAAFPTVATVTDQVSGVVGQISKANINLAAQPAWTAGEVIQVVLTRDATDGFDTLVDDAVVTMAHVLIEVDPLVETLPFVAGEGLVLGDALKIDSAGEVVKASGVTAAGTSNVDGISRSTVLSGALVDVYVTRGVSVPHNFSVAPAGASNGSTVYLSTTAGRATLTAPVAAGSTVFQLGTLVGADGIDTSPNVLFKPQLIAQIS